jgi:hypothetical protein
MNKFKDEFVAEDVTNWISMILEHENEKYYNNEKSVLTRSREPVGDLRLTDGGRIRLISLFTSEGEKV